jgi:hypothetical protein
MKAQSDEHGQSNKIFGPKRLKNFSGTLRIFALAPLPDV